MNHQLILTILAFALLNVAASRPSEAQLLGRRYSAQQRAQIRAMPIYNRPNRPFHFYGNAVRRNATPMTPSALSSLTEVDSAISIQPSQIRPANQANSTEVNLPFAEEVDVPVTVPVAKETQLRAGDKPQSVSAAKTFSQTQNQTSHNVETLMAIEPRAADYSSRRVAVEK